MAMQPVQIPVITGTIKRRMLVNFRADPAVIQAVLPAAFRPKLHNGFAIVGICLIRLERERPSGVPALLGLGSENAAHRFAVEWTDREGKEHAGVFIPRRDTDSLTQRLAGGRVFAVRSHAASFHVSDEGGRIEISVKSSDGEASIDVVAKETGRWPTTSCFDSLQEASKFFEAGSIGYSPAQGREGFDGIELWMPDWTVRPLKVEIVRSSYFENILRFPAGSIEFDDAMIMRDLKHEWRPATGLGI